MGKHNKKNSYYTAPSNKVVDAINRNRHYTDEVKSGLLNLYKLDKELQKYSRQAYQILTDHLRQNEKTEFTVHHIGVSTFNTEDVQQEVWMGILLDFLPNSKAEWFCEYGGECKLITIAFTSSDEEHCFKAAYLPLSQYNDEHFYTALDGDYLTD